MPFDQAAITRTRTLLRDRVRLDYQAVSYSVEDALDALIAFERTDATHASAGDHTSHDAPCFRCFAEAELEWWVYKAEELPK